MTAPLYVEKVVPLPASITRHEIRAAVIATLIEQGFIPPWHKWTSREIAHHTNAMRGSDHD